MSQQTAYLHIDLAPIDNTKYDGLVGGGRRGGEDRVKGKEVGDARCTPYGRRVYFGRALEGESSNMSAAFVTRTEVDEGKKKQIEVVRQVVVSKCCLL
jgi:hypothetical protein